MSGCTRRSGTVPPSWGLQGWTALAGMDAPSGKPDARSRLSSARRRLLETRLERDSAGAAGLPLRTLSGRPNRDHGPLSFAQRRLCALGPAALAELWQEVLMLAEPPSIHDSFFDLGRHSLLATRVLNGIGTRFGELISLRSFFLAPTVGELVTIIAARQTRTDRTQSRHGVVEI